MALQLACSGTLAYSSMQWSLDRSIYAVVQFHAMAVELIILIILKSRLQVESWVTCILSASINVWPQNRLQVESCVTCILSVLIKVWPQYQAAGQQSG